MCLNSSVSPYKSFLLQVALVMLSQQQRASNTRKWWQRRAGPKWEKKRTEGGISWSRYKKDAFLSLTTSAGAAIARWC